MQLQLHLLYCSLIGLCNRITTAIMAVSTLFSPNFLCSNRNVTTAMAYTILEITKVDYTDMFNEAY